MNSLFSEPVVLLLLTTLFSVIGFLIKSSLSRIEKDLSRLNVKFDRIDSRVDLLESFSGRIKQAHNLCHPEAPVNGLSTK